MPRRRPTQGGSKTPGNRQNRMKLRQLIPKAGFDFADKRCRALLIGLESAVIKERIQNFSAGLNKTIVDQALAMLFEKATEVMENEPDQIADKLPGEFWGTIKQTIPWAQDISGSIIFKLVAALLAAHETCLENFPYEKFSIHYGRLATSAHQFSLLLQQHHSE
ncbi:hypothetical protein F4810DRAFT_484497 [Camillea tinctor]|nr:hypothetical protein F4810DRAFT_484497 [Camillea tinctor]